MAYSADLLPLSIFSINQSISIDLLQKILRRTDQRKDGLEGRMDRRLEGRIDGRMNGRMDERMNGRDAPKKKTTRM